MARACTWCGAANPSRTCLPTRPFRPDNRPPVTAAARRNLFLSAIVAVVVAAVGLGSFFGADGRTAKEGSKARSGKGAAGARAVLISATEVQPRTLEIYEDVVGSLENVMDPKIAAEVAGRVTQVLA